MKAPNDAVISYGINPHTKFVEMERENHKKSTTNTENYVKT